MRRMITFLVLFFFFIVGCDNSVEPKVPEEELTFSIEFVGHSSFLITASDSTRILTDPFGTTVPFLNWPDSISCDILTVSHQHADHNQTGGIKGHPRIIQGVVNDSAGVVQIRSFQTQHGLWNGSPMGLNLIFIFTVGDIKVVHLGETGPFTSPEIYEAIKNADVMIAPVGEVASLSFEEIKQLADSVGAKTIIPSHFSKDENNLYYNSSTCSEFVEFMGNFMSVSSASKLIVSGEMSKGVKVLTTLNEK